MLTLQCRRKEFDFAKSFSPYDFLCVKKAWGKKKKKSILYWSCCLVNPCHSLWDRYYQFHNQNTRNSKRYVSCVITSKWHPVPIAPKNLNVEKKKSSRFSMSMHTFNFPYTAEFEIKAFWSCWAFYICPEASLCTQSGNFRNMEFSTHLS